MMINPALGILGMSIQLGWFPARFGRDIHDYPRYVHRMPATYYVLYAFLLRKLLIDVTRSRNKAARRRMIEFAYVGISLAVHGTTVRRGA